MPLTQIAVGSRTRINVYYHGAHGGVGRWMYGPRQLSPREMIGRAGVENCLRAEAIRENIEGLLG